MATREAPSCGLLRIGVRARAGARVAEGLDPVDRRLVGEDIKDVEFAWPVGLPLCRALGRGLWKVRSELTQGRIARVLFCVHQGRMVLLHAFIKKTEKTPPAELAVAMKRKNNLS